LNRLDIIGQLADLKEIDYKNTLAITCIIELLIEKGLINRYEIAEKAEFLENLTLNEIKKSKKASFRY